jgi:prepilin-type N-terminal cleavage/methylation domain-containing protein
MNNRGTSLVELMIVTALIGIAAAGGFSMQAASLARTSTELVQRERALQCLEYEADAIVHRVATDPKRRASLLETLPGARLEIRTAPGDVTTIAVRWTSKKGFAERSLIVLGRPR